MVLKEYDKTIYFCTNLIEKIVLDESEDFLIPDLKLVDKMLFSFTNIKCLNCNEQNSIQCNLNLFNIQMYITDLKKSIGKDRLNSKKKSLNKETDINNVQLVNSSQNYLFYTQNDSEYYVQPNEINSTVDSQYMKINSILDALENIGYYGFVTFRATVQRIGIVRNITSSFNTTQLSQSIQAFR